MSPHLTEVSISLSLVQETCRRLLYLTVPRVVAVSPQMRLVEDNPASISLLDIYKHVSLCQARSYRALTLYRNQILPLTKLLIYQILRLMFY